MANQETSLKTSFSKYLTVLATGIHSLYRSTISQSNVYVLLKILLKCIFYNLT